jgi:hypothetical protein
MFGMPGTPGFRQFETAFADAFKVLRQQGKLLSTLLSIALTDLEVVDGTDSGSAASATKETGNRGLSRPLKNHRIYKVNLLLLLEAVGELICQ